MLGAFDAQRLVGNMGFVREQREKTGHKGLIWGVYVTPDYRGCGVGRRLLEQVIQRAKTNPVVEQILISVNPEQQTAHRMYLAAGFVPFGREPRALKIGGEYLDEEHLILFLRGDA